MLRGLEANSAYKMWHQGHFRVPFFMLLDVNH
jgi:hypothetical protein